MTDSKNGNPTASPTAPFPGFTEPKENWSKLPHQLVDAFPLIETLGEALVILYVLRHTWGFQDQEKRITTDEFQRGRKRKDGTRLDHGTGLSAPTVRTSIKKAIKHGFLAVETDARDKARTRKFYSLNMVVKDLPSRESPLPPDGKKFIPGWKEPYHRTGKETTERNPNGRNSGMAHPFVRSGNGTSRKREPVFRGDFIEKIRKARNGNDKV